MKTYKIIIMIAVLMGMLWITIPSVYADSTIVPFYSKATGQEPWVTDLTPTGTKLLKDLEKGTGSSFGFDGAESNAISLFGYQYFFAAGSLYRSDATAKRTDIENNISDFQITHLVKHKNKLFFTSRDTPSIYLAHPRGEMLAASTVVTYDQSKAPREIISIQSNVYDHKMMLLIENQPHNQKWTYDLRLSNGQKGWSRIQKYKYSPSHPFTKKLSKSYITDRFIYFYSEGDTNNEIWMTPNLEKSPDVAVLKLFKFSEKKISNNRSIIADKHYLYFATEDGNIIKTDGSLKRTKQINHSALPKEHIDGFLTIFKNHLIYKTSHFKVNKHIETLYKINLQTGHWKKLAEAERDWILPR